MKGDRGGMMATQPRKFSEKIAMHNQKQAEGDAAFQQIMREVTDVTSNPTRSGNLDDTHCSRLDEAIAAGNNMYRERGQSVGSGGPMRNRQMGEKRRDVSPYACGPYLSPPDLPWRRTNSDSALHQSVQNPNVGGLHSPGSQRRAAMFENQQYYDPTGCRGRPLVSSSSIGVMSIEKRPRSCCDVPASIPDITICPSQQDPGAIQIPIGNNTGSLPDLTSFQFSSPLSTPLDPDDHQSSYSSNSPQSPQTLSPTSLPPRTPGRFSFQSTPPHESPGPPSYPVSPGSPSSVQNHLSVPYANSRYPRFKQGYVFDGSPVENMPGYQSQMQQHHQQQSYVFSQNNTLPSSQPANCIDQMNSDPLLAQQHRRNSSVSSYRSPQMVTRPSPQSSPVLNVKQRYNSTSSNNTSPLSSAPQSPTSSCNSAGSVNVPISYGSSQAGDYYMTAAQETALQQHFEQIRMLDSPIPSTVMMPMTNGSSNATYTQRHTKDLISSAASVVTDLATDQGYFSTSPSQQLTYPCGSGHTTAATSSQTTPNTPSSIPDIVLTDFSSTEELTRSEMSKDLSCCDIANFFSSSSNLREDGLDPIDLEGLQMLSESDILAVSSATNPNSHDQFTLDSL